MKKGGFLIRFIDIGLIVLLSFLAISDINIDAQIRLPGSESDRVDNPQQLTIAVIRILEDGGFMLQDVEEQALGFSGIASLEQLEYYLIQIRNIERSRGRDLVVLINPDEFSIVQYTINVMDLCDRHGIAKNINAASLRL